MHGERWQQMWVFHPLQRLECDLPRVPLYRALMASVVLHAAIIAPWSWPFHQPQLASQPFLQATLQPPTSAPGERPTTNDRQTPETPSMNPKPSAGPDRLSGRDGTSSIAGGGDARPQPAEASGNTREALAEHQPLPPEYPTEALRRNLEGCVLASIRVADDGQVVQVDILASDHPGIFDQAITDAQAAARYVPARHAGQPVESRVLAVSAFVMTPGKRLNCALKYAPMAEKLLGMTSR